MSIDFITKPPVILDAGPCPGVYSSWKAVEETLGESSFNKHFGPSTFKQWVEEDDSEFFHSPSWGLDDNAETTEVNGVKFAQPSRAISDVVVMTDIKRFDEAWSKSRDTYVTPGGGGNAIKTRYPQFAHYLSLGKTILMSEVGLGGGDIPHFTNGRHRFSVLRDQGWDKIPMSVSSEDASKFRELYGI